MGNCRIGLESNDVLVNNLTLSLVAAFALAVHAPVSGGEEADHWSYAGEMGPAHWAELEVGSACSGSRQSPVNIIRTDTTPRTSDDTLLELHYPSVTRILSAANNGHSIQLDFEPGDEIRLEGEQYFLQQIHFHSPSEHTLNGVRYPLEMHLVHSNAARDRFTVLSMLGYEGRSSSVFRQFEQFDVPEMGQSMPMAMPFDLSAILPPTLTPRFHYSGSLTTPPCTENVNWVVFESPFMLAEEQVKRLQQRMPVNNYRDVQPLNGRVISLIVH